MFGQTLNLRVEADLATATRDVRSSTASWLFMMGFCFGCFVLGVASACLVLPSASQEPAHHVPAVITGDSMFIPTLGVPLRQNPVTDPQIKTPSSVIAIASRTSIVPNAESPLDAVSVTARAGASSPVLMQMAPQPLKTKPRPLKTGPAPLKTAPAPLKTAPGEGASVQVAKPKLKRVTEIYPDWKVLLLGDLGYEENAVIKVLQKVIPVINNFREAKEKFDEAQSSGKSLLLACNKELAEAYVEQLKRCDPEMIVFATIEEDK